MSITPGYDTAEAIVLLSICSNTYPPDPSGSGPLKEPDPPEGWQKDYTSPIIGKLDNRFEIWKGPDSKAAISFRGTVPKYGSALEDVLGGMIPATGSMVIPQLGEKPIAYSFAKSEKAAVHAGLAIGTLTLVPMAIEHLERLQKEGIKAVYITGHSQGAILATLFRSYLAYKPVAGFASDQYKTYVFAQASPGNSHYGYDFEMIASNQGLAFRVANSQDWVPQMLPTVETFKNVNRPNPFELIDELLDGIPEWKKLLVKGVLDAMEGELEMTQKVLVVSLGDLVKKLMEKQLGTGLKLPDFVPDMNYVCCGAPYVLKGVESTNPREPKDYMWQHHTAMYYYLLTGKPIPLKCD